MKSVFLSYHYDDANRALAQKVEALVESHGLRAVTGDVLGGGGLTEELRRQIGEAEALIALLTRHQELAGGQWATHPFLPAELQHARGIGKPAIALLQTGVQNAGLYQEHEYIPLDLDEPLNAFLRLSKTIFKWKQRAGRALKLQVVPEPVAQEIWAQRDSLQWEYRLSSGFDETEWRKAKPKREPGGLFVWVQVSDETMLIEVRVTGPVTGQVKTWLSDATPFHMPVALADQQ